MKEYFINKLSFFTKKASELITSKTSNYSDNELLGKIGLLLIESVEALKLDEINKTEIFYIINSIENKLCYQESIFYYISFYKVPQIVYNKDYEEFSKLVKKINIDITNFKIKIFSCNQYNFPLNSSDDNYFFSRGNCIVRGFKNAIKYNDDEYFIPLLYISLNYYQVLKYYICSKDTCNKDIANSNKNDFEKLFHYISTIPKLVDKIKSNIQILFFWESQLSDINLSFYIKFMDCFTNRSYGDKERWALISLSQLNTKLFLDIINENKENIILTSHSNQYTDILTANIIVQYLYLSNNNYIDTLFEVSVPISTKSCHYTLNYFFSNFTKINASTITSNDLNLLNNYTDEILRKKLGKIIKNISANEIQRQIEKPHGTLEISDIDLRFDYNDSTYYLSIPVKSGREIRTDTVPEQFMHQILKPFSHFGNNCIVVFISAKKCSQGLETYIQRMSIRNPNWKIYIIQEKQLAGLFKINNILN